MYFEVFEKHDLMLVQNREQMQAMQEQLSMMYQVFTEGKAKQTDKLAEAIENPYGPKKIEETTQEESLSRSEKVGRHNTRSTKNDRHKNSLGESVDSNRGGTAATVPKHSAQRKMRASTEQEKDLLGKLRRAPRTARDTQATNVTGSNLNGLKTNKQEGVGRYDSAAARHLSRSLAWEDSSDSDEQSTTSTTPEFTQAGYILFNMKNGQNDGQGDFSFVKEQHAQVISTKTIDALTKQLRLNPVAGFKLSKYNGDPEYARSAFAGLARTYL
jgi:hypothetical protein